MYSHTRNLQGMHGLKNSYINSFIFISHFSHQASQFNVYAFMVVTMKKWGKLQIEYRVLFSFVIKQTLSKLSFLAHLSRRSVVCHP